MRNLRWSSLRDIFLFLGGMVGVGHETLIATAERPTLLILFAAMMGLPAFLRQGEGPSGTGDKPIFSDSDKGKEQSKESKEDGE